MLFLADLGRFTQAVAHLTALEIARVVDRFYTEAADAVEHHGGRVLKFDGDSCLAVFEPSLAPAAVACAIDLRRAVRDLGTSRELELDLGVNIHIATVATGTFGPRRHAAQDVIGVGVSHVHRMGRGPGIRISEPVYRTLPSADRSPWRKHQPPATYTLQA